VIIAGVGFYVWDHNRLISEQAAANNGAVCNIVVELDDELYAIYQGGGLNKAITGNMDTVVEGDVETTTVTSQTTIPDLVVELSRDIANLSVVGGANCTPVVSQIPAMQSGRVKVGIEYFRPDPVETP
jgi:hypothetical protein